MVDELVCSCYLDTQYYWLNHNQLTDARSCEGITKSQITKPRRNCIKNNYSLGWRCFYSRKIWCNVFDKFDSGYNRDKIVTSWGLSHLLDPVLWRYNYCVNIKIIIESYWYAITIRLGTASFYILVTQVGIWNLTNQILNL
jgi:hypothetical protein